MQKNKPFSSLAPPKLVMVIISLSATINFYQSSKALPVLEIWSSGSNSFKCSVLTWYEEIRKLHFAPMSKPYA